MSAPALSEDGSDAVPGRRGGAEATGPSLALRRLDGRAGLAGRTGPQGTVARIVFQLATKAANTGASSTRMSCSSLLRSALPV